MTEASTFEVGLDYLIPSRKYVVGSTMIELMVTVATVAVLASIGIPSYSDFMEKRRLSGGAVEITSFLSLARNSAVKHNQQTTVSFNHTSDTDWCLGVILGADPCDCTNSTVSDADYCALKYTDDSGTAVIEPQWISSADYSGFLMETATTGSGGSALTFDPVRGVVAFFADTATIAVQSTNTKYELEINVSPTGAVKTCTKGAPLSGFKSC